MSFSRLESSWLGKIFETINPLEVVFAIKTTKKMPDFYYNPE
jgi:hypothetical protein